MRPIRTTASNFTFLGPDPSIADLPCQREDGVTRSVFKLTDEERERIAAGGNLELAMWCDGHPPISLAVTDAIEIAEPGDTRCEDCNALYVRSRGLTRCGQCDGLLVEASIPGG